jgi:hypothetical protein
LQFDELIESDKIDGWSWSQFIDIISKELLPQPKIDEMQDTNQKAPNSPKNTLLHSQQSFFSKEKLDSELSKVMDSEYGGLGIDQVQIILAELLILR